MCAGGVCKSTFYAFFSVATAAAILPGAYPLHRVGKVRQERAWLRIYLCPAHRACNFSLFVLPRVAGCRGKIGVLGGPSAECSLKWERDAERQRRMTAGEDPRCKAPSPRPPPPGVALPWCCVSSGRARIPLEQRLGPCVCRDWGVGPRRPGTPLFGPTAATWANLLRLPFPSDVEQGKSLLCSPLK